MSPRRREEDVSALLRALYAAGRVCEDRNRIDEVAEILARPAYLDAPAERIARALRGRLRFTAGEEARPIPDFLLMHREAANFPWVSQALWLYTQMARWGDAELSPESERAVRRVFRPDLYRRALGGTGAALPSASAKMEGAIANPSGCGHGSGPPSAWPGSIF
jgi:NitT/TauT family transport system ATP-binding protein